MGLRDRHLRRAASLDAGGVRRARARTHRRRRADERGGGVEWRDGLLPHEALAFIRALAGLAFVGYDVVEVSPQFDGPGQVTALNAASVAYEFLALTALSRPAS